MPLPLALLLSLALHAGLVLMPAWLAPGAAPVHRRGIDARLLPPSHAPDRAASVATDPAPVPPPSAAAARHLTGTALHRAEAALSDHLYYPPQAVAEGIEGDVILLLTLADDGRLVSAAVARGSGHPVLDEAALDAARRIGALPGNPRQTLFPVRFRLR